MLKDKKKQYIYLLDSKEKEKQETKHCFLSILTKQDTKQGEKE